MTASNIIAAARLKLLEPAPEVPSSFWKDAELLTHLNEGVKDLWRAITDTLQDYWFTTSTAVTMASGALQLSNVPADVSRIIGIEPVTPNNYPTLNFFPKRYTHPDMIAARATDPQDPSVAGPIFYSPTGAGAPVGTPVIYVAPPITQTVPIRLTYVPVAPDLTITAPDSPNPVPGESNGALIAWVVAHAITKDADGGSRAPDSDWLAKYATEKTNILTFLTPRTDDEPQVAEAIHEPYIM